MCMSVLEKRMQILLDQQRYQRLEKEAERRGQSVGATVRDAIDLLFEQQSSSRMAARRSLLRTPLSDAPEPEFDKNALLQR